jgi:unsaturated rhamnogalacturonyl hydrolase
MFVYALAKGADAGLIDTAYRTIAESSFRSIMKTFVTEDSSGCLQLHATSHGAGLGGTPYRDGSYDYYVHIPQRTNDFRALGPFILAALEVGDPAPWLGAGGVK